MSRRRPPRQAGPTGAPGRLLPVTDFGPLDPLSERAHQPYADGDPAGTVRACDELLPLVRLAGDVATERFLHYSRSIGLRELGRYDEVVLGARDLLQLAGDDPCWRAKALALLAEASAAQGRTTVALDHLAEGLELVESHPAGGYNHMSASVALAISLGAVGLHEVADELLARLRRDPSTSALAVVHVLEESCSLRAAWGAAHELVGRQAQARGHFLACAEHALALRRAAQDAATRARGDIYLALALHRLGDMDACWSVLPEPGRLDVVGTESADRLVALVVRGQVLLARGDVGAARADLVAAEALAHHSRRHVWRWTAVECLAACDVAELGDHPAARRWREHARSLHRRLDRDSTGRGVELQALRRIRQLVAEHRGVHEEASTDPLTGLANRRALVRCLEQVSRPLGAVFVDVDHFKDVNDRFSHDVGDRVLVRLAQLLRAACRATDLVVRYGGDEFVVVVLDDDPLATEVVAGRVQAGVRGEPWDEVAPGLALTVSLGVEPCAEVGTVLAAADAALRAAKRGGRDRVVGRQVGGSETSGAVTGGPGGPGGRSDHGAATSDPPGMMRG